MALYFYFPHFLLIKTNNLLAVLSYILVFLINVIFVVQEKMIFPVQQSKEEISNANSLSPFKTGLCQNIRSSFCQPLYSLQSGLKTKYFETCF